MPGPGRGPFILVTDHGLRARNGMQASPRGKSFFARKQTFEPIRTSARRRPLATINNRIANRPYEPPGSSDMLATRVGGRRMFSRTGSTCTTAGTLTQHEAVIARKPVSGADRLRRRHTVRSRFVTYAHCRLIYSLRSHEKWPLCAISSQSARFQPDAGDWRPNRQATCPDVRLRLEGAVSVRTA